MPKIDRIKEEVAILRSAGLVLLVADFSLIAWFFQNFGKSPLLLIILCVMIILVIVIGLTRLTKKLYLLLDELEEL